MSGTNVISYLFKMFNYIWKMSGVGDTNRIQLCSPTDEPRDEVGEFFNAKETCGTEAFRRMARMPSIMFVPHVEKVAVHAQR